MTISDRSSIFEQEIRFRERITELEKTNHELSRRNLFFEGINRIFSIVVKDQTEEELGNECLAVALEVTGSKFGFFGLMGDDGLLHDIAISDMGWEQCLMHDKTGHRRPPGNFIVHGLYGNVITSEKSFFTNDPLSHPDSIGLPSGHPPLTSFLGVPLILNSKVVGMLGVANREGGYSSEQQADLEAIAPAIMQSLHRKKSEMALGVSIDRLGLALDAANAGIWEWNTRTNANIRSKEIWGLYGLEPHSCQPSYEAWRQCIHPADLELVERKVQEAAANATELRIEWRVLDPNGTERWLMSVGRPVLDATFQLNSYLGVVIDVTERIQAQKALMESEQRLQAIIDGSDNAFYVKDLDGHFILINKHLEKLLGMNRDEVIGKTDYDFFAPELADYYKMHDSKILETGVPEQLEEVSDLVDGWHTFLANKFPLYDSQGKPYAICGISTDITKRKQEQLLLKADMAALTRMHELSKKVLRTGGIQPLLDEIIYSAVAIVGAKFGTLQLLEDDSLQIVSHYGHQQPFLDYFASAENVASVCGEAMQRWERVIIEDVETSSLFAGTPSLDVMRKAGVRSVQSTPMVSHTGELLGILTTQWDVPYSPDEHDLWRIDLLARQAADMIDQAKTQKKLQDSEERLHLLSNNLPDSALYQYVHELDGSVRFLYCSAGIEKLNSVSIRDVLHDSDTLHRQMSSEYFEQLVENEARSARELSDFDMDVPMRLPGGQLRWMRLHSRPRRLPDGRTIWDGVQTDITGQKIVEQEREMTVEFLRLMNENKGVVDLVHSAVNFFRERSGFEAVGIRLKDGDDYPYFETSGFSAKFVELERSLCVRDAFGQIIRDNNGYPIQECMCCNVICGRFDPSKPFFTTRGSFCTNCTTELLATTTDADRQARTRNRCNGEGYESVALIALCVGEERLGLLQLNDKRKGLFSPGTISVWERLADSLAVAIAKAQADESLQRAHETLQTQSEELQAQSEEIKIQNEELHAQSEELRESYKTLQESEERFRTMANSIPQLVWIARPDGSRYWYNERWYSYTGTTPEQMEGWGWQSVHDPEMLPKVLEQLDASFATGKMFDMELPLRGADGIFRPFLTRVLGQIQMLQTVRRQNKCC
jgi:PAS domain S-box-containing protein